MTHSPMAELINHLHRKFFRPFGKAIVFSVAFFGLLMLPLPHGYSQTENPEGGKEEKNSSDEALEKYLEQQMKTDFVYKREGRPDPFFPFITQEILQTEAEAEHLEGMRRYEPGQLTLVAIVFTEQKAIAMVQDSVGVGYTLQVGDKVGRTGEVVEIVPNMVKIQEITFSLTKEKQYRTVEMVLKKEGDKEQ